MSLARPLARVRRLWSALLVVLVVVVLLDISLSIADLDVRLLPDGLAGAVLVIGGLAVLTLLLNVARGPRTRRSPWRRRCAARGRPSTARASRCRATAHAPAASSLPST